ncbi:MAG: site-specific DNA-methyltransferase [Ruminococcus flavefaciens]|nr:site-specific DNA-methyltransferase [Ruminococcus flavefaciens]
MPTLDWIGKDKVINHHMEVPYRVLDEQYSYGEDSGNMIIHGDNLSALKSLLPQYEGRIKCIYIDPPYNTGNENWVYNDNVNDPHIKKWLGEVVGTEGVDLSRHDKWLCMMYPRLKLLYRLLDDDGVIFISIDDNEQSNLKLICDEIFGIKNRLGTISNTNNPKGRSDDKFIATAHEYILVYAKNSELTKWFGFEPTEEIIVRYNKLDENGKKYREIDLRKTGENDLREDRPNLFYYFYYNEKTGDFFPSSEDKTLDDYIKIFPLRADGKEGNWRWGIDTARNNISELMPKFMPTRKIWGVMQKDYLENRDLVKPTSSWTFKDVNSERGSESFLNLGFVKKDFPKPKPVGTIERCLKLSTDKDAIILDSFAGSGTTAHAVLNMNKADSGNRKFILIEMCDYAETITAERVKRVIDGYGEGKKKVDGTGGGFKFYELGEKLLDGEYLNESVSTEKIHEYVYFTETKQPVENKSDEPYFMGKYLDTAYYFCYEKNAVTTLDRAFLHTVKTTAESYVIYADKCIISDDELEKSHITFKKIPRDITKL